MKENAISCESDLMQIEQVNAKTESKTGQTISRFLFWNMLLLRSFAVKFVCHCKRKPQKNYWIYQNLFKSVAPEVCHLIFFKGYLQQGRLQ